MPFYPVAGCKIFIGGVLDEKAADFVASDFSSQTWVEITKWTQMGDFGDTNNPVSLQVIGESRDKDQKGTANAGDMQNVFAAIDTDPGQIALRAAAKVKANYAFQIVMNDAPAVGSAPKPGQRLFVALVMSARDGGGGANTVRSLNATLNINSNIVVVAPSAT
jgi:hypothetical protein